MKKGWQILIGLLTGVVFIFSCRQAEPEKEVKTLKPDSTKMTELPPPGAPAVVPSREDLQKQISDQEKSIDPNKEIDLNKARQMIRLYDTYHKNYYLDFVCPDYLFKAGEICENIHQYNRAAEFYKMCCDEYNDNFKLRPECLFSLARVYDYRLNNYIKAKETYRKVIEQYPKTQLAQDVIAAIKLMGRSDQDIVRDFERKNAEKK